MRSLISDETWAVLCPMVERCRSKLGPEPDLPDRMFVYHRSRCWIHSGRLKRLFALMAERPECEDARRLMIDWTVVQAPHHAAGVQRKRAGEERSAAGPRRTGVRQSQAVLSLRHEI